jgi:hypothetical protein
MKRASLLVIVIAGSAASSAGHLAHADADECHEAVEHYNSVLSDVSHSLKRYANCVASGAGHDDCSTEFRHLKGDQDDFESAVSDIENNCE